MMGYTVLIILIGSSTKKSNESFMIGANEYKIGDPILFKK